MVTSFGVCHIILLYKDVMFDFQNIFIYYVRYNLGRY